MAGDVRAPPAGHLRLRSPLGTGQDDSGGCGAPSRRQPSHRLSLLPGGREELIGAVVSWEFGRFFLRLYEEVHEADSLEEVMERG